jgi:hypothetical protein
MLPLPLQFLAAWLAVWLGRVLQRQVDYLIQDADLAKQQRAEQAFWRLVRDTADLVESRHLGRFGGVEHLDRYVLFFHGPDAEALAHPSLSTEPFPEIAHVGHSHDGEGGSRSGFGVGFGLFDGATHGGGLTVALVFDHQGHRANVSDHVHLTKSL